MKLLTFLARRFAWEGHERTLPDAPAEVPAGEVLDAVVAYVHLEQKDESDAERARAFKHALKHLKWLANKRDWRRIVLHSFAHLGGESADAAFARAFLEELAERLRGTGYSVELTPFGWFCSWGLAVDGDSLAKVWKEVSARRARGDVRRAASRPWIVASVDRSERGS